MPDRNHPTYRLLTGIDDLDFDLRVAARLEEGYVLHGSPALAFDGERPIVAQAVVLPPEPSSSGSHPGRDQDVEPRAPR